MFRPIRQGESTSHSYQDTSKAAEKKTYSGREVKPQANKDRRKAMIFHEPLSQSGTALSQSREAPPSPPPRRKAEHLSRDMSQFEELPKLDFTQVTFEDISKHRPEELRELKPDEIKAMKLSAFWAIKEDKFKFLSRDAQRAFVEKVLTGIKDPKFRQQEIQDLFVSAFSHFKAEDIIQLNEADFSAILARCTREEKAICKEIQIRVLHDSRVLPNFDFDNPSPELQKLLITKDKISRKTNSPISQMSPGVLVRLLFASRNTESFLNSAFGDSIRADREPTRITRLIESLSQDAIRKFKPEHFTNIPESCVVKFTPKQVEAMPPRAQFVFFRLAADKIKFDDYIPAIHPAIITPKLMEHLSSDQLDLFTDDQINNMSKEAYQAYLKH